MKRVGFVKVCAGERWLRYEGGVVKACKGWVCEGMQGG